MKHVMLDLETMGNGNTAAIIAIGACYFDPDTGQIGEAFSRNVTLESSTAAGLVMDTSTVLWWMKQDDEARAAFKREAVELDIALADFLEFLPAKSKGKVNIWGNGATFDNVILENAFSACGMSAPWEFWNHRDVRTVVDMGRAIVGIDPKRDFPFEGTKHEALADALHQAKYVTAIWQGFKGCVKQASVGVELAEREKRQAETVMHYRR